MYCRELEIKGSLWKGENIGKGAIGFQENKSKRMSRVPPLTVGWAYNLVLFRGTDVKYIQQEEKVIVQPSFCFLESEAGKHGAVTVISA